MSTENRPRAGNQTRPLNNAMRASNECVLNPVMMRLAGRRHWYAAAIRHTGRRTGKEYATPVVAVRAGDGFIVPLPYGTGVNWLRDVLASGLATTSSGWRTPEPEGASPNGPPDAFPTRGPTALGRHLWTLCWAADHADAGGSGFTFSEEP
ncbi:hypothetical protein [Amycolatopsis anabasis]|uniref:hypothetical protein n=1 Tax=Amycolatopsis anabasis TaxID=1840409 RepID=UPI0015D3E10C|nr:hypothetical protein [Amycolatopsis anabasis]